MIGPALSAFIGGHPDNPFSIYAVASPTAARVGGVEAWDGIFADDASYCQVGVTSQHSNSAVVDVYDGGVHEGFTGGGLTFVAPVLISALFAAPNVPVDIAINSGGTFAGSTTSTQQILVTTNPVLIGGTGAGDPTANRNLQGQIAAVFTWNRRLSAPEDLVVRTFFKNYYALGAW
jgi:hypothetical protein